MKTLKLIAFLLGSAAIFPAASCDQAGFNEQKYQYVLLFGNDFPIPLRFRLVSWIENTLEYTSSAPEVGDSDYRSSDTAGIIEIGPRQMLEKEVGSQSIVMPIAVCESLEISRVVPKDVSEEVLQKFPSMTLILGEKHYMTVVDYDENLWRELVRLFIRNADLASSCRI